MGRIRLSYSCRQLASTKSSTATKKKKGANIPVYIRSRNPKVGTHELHALLMRLHRQPRRLDAFAGKCRMPASACRHGCRGNGSIHERQAAQKGNLVALHNHFGHCDFSCVTVPARVRVSAHFARPEHRCLLGNHFQFPSQHLRSLYAPADGARQRSGTVQFLVDLALDIAVRNPQPQHFLPHIGGVDLANHSGQRDVKVLDDGRAAKAEGQSTVEHVTEPEQNGLLVVEHRHVLICADGAPGYAVVTQVLAQLGGGCVELPGKRRARHLDGIARAQKQRLDGLHARAEEELEIGEPRLEIVPAQFIVPRILAHRGVALGGDGFLLEEVVQTRIHNDKGGLAELLKGKVHPPTRFCKILYGHEAAYANQRKRSRRRLFDFAKHGNDDLHRGHGQFAEAASGKRLLVSKAYLPAAAGTGRAGPRASARACALLLRKADDLLEAGQGGCHVGRDVPQGGALHGVLEEFRRKHGVSRQRRVALEGGGVQVRGAGGAPVVFVAAFAAVGRDGGRGSFKLFGDGGGWLRVFVDRHGGGVDVEAVTARVVDEVAEELLDGT